MLKLNVPGGETRILLHVCCAPCSGAILACMLENGLHPTVYFSNANITPFAEYSHRLSELLRYAGSLGIETVEDSYDHADWLTAVRGLEREPERGARCLECFRYRLLRAARYGAAHGFPVLTTSLASSRWKDLSQVDEAGRWACEQAGNIRWWGQNWRKGGLQPLRAEIIRKQQFYNQTFCGCEFSAGARRDASCPVAAPDNVQDFRP